MKLFPLIILIVCLAGCGGHVTPLVTGFEGKPLPAFDVLKMDSSTILNTANIPAGNPIVLFLFSPYCPYCRAQTEDIVKNIRKLQNIQVYMVSPFPFDNVKNYSEQYQLSSYQGITVVQDTKGFFGTYYKAPGVPYIAVYNKDKKLNRVLMGNVGVSAIKTAAEAESH